MLVEATKDRKVFKMKCQIKGMTEAEVARGHYLHLDRTKSQKLMLAHSNDISKLKLTPNNTNTNL